MATKLGFLNKQGIMSRPIWQPMHELMMFKDCSMMDLVMTNNLKKRIVNIVSTPIEVKYE